MAGREPSERLTAACAFEGCNRPTPCAIHELTFPLKAARLREIDEELGALIRVRGDHSDSLEGLLRHAWQVIHQTSGANHAQHCLTCRKIKAVVERA